MIEEAGKIFLKERRVSKNRGIIQYKLNCLAELARIAVLWRKTDQLDRINKYIKKTTSNENEKKHSLPIALLQRCAGDLSLLDKQLDQAIKFYQEALPIIAAKRRYEPYAITGQLTDIQKNVLPYIAVETVKELGQRLRTFWMEKEHDKSYPEALNAFGYWQSGDINTWG